jgi:cyanophycin synthetase
MKIVETRFLRGPNPYAATSCLLAVIAPDADEPAKIPGFGARLRMLLPALPSATADRLRDDADHADAVEPVTMELQRLAGAPGAFSRTLAGDGVLRVICGYSREPVACAAFAGAHALIEALARGHEFDLDGTLRSLRATAERHAAK